MAGHVLSITNGTTTITLTSGDYYVTAYNIRQAEKDALGRYQPVTETIELAVTGSDIYSMATNVRQLQKLVDEASREQGEYVYLQANLMTDAYNWKARILSARLEPADNVMSVYSNAMLEFTLTLTREPVFRGAAASITWTVGGTAKTWTNGASYTLGSMSTFVETPAIVTITNNQGSAQWKRIWVGNDYVTGGATLKQAPGLGSETVTGSNHTVYYGEKSLGDVSVFDGHEWRVMAALNSGTAGVEVKGRLLYDIGGLYKVARSGLPVTLVDSATGAVVDFGSFMLPPNGRGGANDGISMGFSAWGTGSVNVSYYTLFPGFNMRRYEIAHPATYPVALGAELKDDPRDDGKTYIKQGSVTYPIVRTVGQPIMLMPDKTNQIVVLIEEEDDFDPTLQYLVTIEYEQQRLTI